MEVKNIPALLRGSSFHESLHGLFREKCFHESFRVLFHESFHQRFDGSLHETFYLELFPQMCLDVKTRIKLSFKEATSIWKLLS